MLAMNGHGDLAGAQIRHDYRPYGAALAKQGMNGAARTGAIISPTTSINMSSPNASTILDGDDIQRRRHRHMWIITGPAGCGKTAVAKFLKKKLGIPYIEGDDYHPSSNLQKMQQNIPLTDADRWDWLITLRNAAMSSLSAPNTSPPPSPGLSSLRHAGVVVTCSALKRKYRDVIRVAAYENHGVRVHFIYLHAPESVILQRVVARQGHFMGSSMVHSQFESLEEPGSEEMGRDVLSCDCSAELGVVEKRVLELVRRVLDHDSASGNNNGAGSILH